MLRDRVAGFVLALALVAPPLLLHVDHLGPGRIPFYRDLSRTHLPFKRIATTAISAGQLPLWCPQHASGSQLASNPNFFHLQPVSLLFALLPFATAFSFGLAALSVLASVGTGLWLRERGASRAAAAAGGVSFALGGLMVSTTNLYNLHAAYASVPLALWASARLVRDTRASGVALVALCLAAVATGGEPSAWGWSVLLGPLLAGRRPGARALGATALAAALSLLLAAAQLVPLAELTPTTVRGAGLTFAGSTYHSLRPQRLLELVWPYAYGQPLAPDAPTGRPRHHDGGTPLLLSIYPGGSVLLLAGLGLMTARQRTPLVGIGLLSLLLALGRHTPLFGLVWELAPPLHWFRYPEKLLLPFFLALAGLVAAGLERLRTAVRPAVPMWPVVGIVAVELLWVHARLVPGCDSAIFMEAQPMHRALAGHRVYFWLEPDRYAPPAPDSLTQLTRYQIEAVPPSGAPFGVDYVLDPDPDLLDTSRMLAFSRLVHRASEARPRLLPLTAVDRVVSPRPLHYTWLDPVSSPELHVYALDEPLPYARVVDSGTVLRAEDATEAEVRLASAALDPRRQTVVETSATLPPSASPGGASWSRPSPSRIDVRAEGPGVLIIAESYDSGWRASINGGAVKVYPANLTFLAVLLPNAGRQLVQLDFQPAGLSTGIALSALGVALTIALWLIPVYTRRRPSTSATPSARAASTA